MRQPPQSAKTVGITIFYMTYLGSGAPGGGFILDAVSREPCTVRGHEGRFVRYGGEFRRLHEPSELPALLKEIRASGGVPCLSAGGGKKFDEANDPPLPFVKDWEPPAGWYKLA